MLARDVRSEDRKYDILPYSVKGTHEMDISRKGFFADTTELAAMCLTGALLKNQNGEI